MQSPEWRPVPRAAWVRHSRISIRRWVGEGFSAHHREQPRGSVAQPDLSAGHQTGTGNTTGRAASVPHFSFNRKSLLLPFGGVCSRLYSREIHLEMSSE